MIPIPQTYPDWVNVLAMLKDKTDDTDVLLAMQGGKLEWQTGVAERFVKRLTEAINHRMNCASDKFQKDIGRTGGAERAIVQAILTLRKEMRFLSQAVDLPALPETQRNQLKGLIVEQADIMQQSLEDSAKKDRSGKLLSIVRNNKVNSLGEREFC